MYAYQLTKNNSDYKIICIGASINIASGEEKEVPYYLRNYEFLWRLRTEFFRRLKRLFESLYFYLKAKYLTKKYEKILFLKID
jgi:UDP-N-acetyl-D-mannosaminuronic acid transferase (WecB/TagA/CpsF family)